MNAEAQLFGNLRKMQTRLEDVAHYSLVLDGIKGQYLIFDDNRVLNIRKHNGYRITIN